MQQFQHICLADVRTAIVAAALMTAHAGAAAAQPATDIFLAEVSRHDGALRIDTPSNVTARDGYDNQPWFLPDGSAFLYSSERDGQIDIFRYDIGSARSVRITDTPENEYSPSLPLDGSRMMVVRWPVDMSTGALWWYAPDGTPLEPARGSVDRVGYYAFGDEHTLALFINDSVQSFVLSDMRTGEAVRAGQQMNGSAPRTIPGQRAVSFQRRGDDGDWWLMRLDMETRAASPLVRMVGGVANYTWTPDGAVLAAVRNTIYEWRPGSDAWHEVVAFDDPGLQAISRIAISAAGDRLALVSARP